MDQDLQHTHDMIAEWKGKDEGLYGELYKDAIEKTLEKLYVELDSLERAIHILTVMHVSGHEMVKKGEPDGDL